MQKPKQQSTDQFQ